MRNGLPTPGILDGMAAYDGPGRSTVLIRNHENRSRPGEITVPVPTGKRYDPDVNVRGGNTKLVVSRDRRLEAVFPVLGGTHTNCAGGPTPWGTWITCEEIFNYGSVESNVTPGTGVPHGYSFEIPADANGPVTPQPIIDAGRFSHEAVAWLDGALYETEDRGDAGFYRFIPERRPKEAGDLATFGGTLQALVVRGRPNFDANSANTGESYPVEWVTIEEPNPLTDTVRAEAQAKGAAIFDRTEGIWTAGDRVYFDCTTGGDAGLGQLWEFRPRSWGGELNLIYESVAAEDLENPDNLVIVPQTGDVFLQEDSDGEQFVRGVTPRGQIYDFARTVLNTTEFCGGCFSPDGRTFFVNQQGDRLTGTETPTSMPDARAGLTFAIWGEFEQRRH
jgi:secreted PhoX family phosphatase